MGPGNHMPNMSLSTIRGIMQKNIVVDMDEQACSEALADLNAYYKVRPPRRHPGDISANEQLQVARKTFVDNVCRQVIERHLLRNLPKIFSPEDVAGYPDEKLQRIAGERQDVVSRRKGLQEQLETLQAGLKDLKK